MDTRHFVESPLAAASLAEAEPLGPALPATLGTRRDFCVAACQALSLGAIAATLQACGGGGSPNEPSGSFGNVPTLPSLNATVANGAASLTVDGTALSAAGGAAIVTSSLGSMLVVRNDATTVSAYTSTCTHQQCTINGFGGNVFQCPCHGSQFNPANGSVVRGPATQSLRRFTASINNGVVSITA
ncbi:MAG: Rieske (2Fe-2S) protein [Vicinamibacteraceae bacterium]